MWVINNQDWINMTLKYNRIKIAREWRRQESVATGWRILLDILHKASITKKKRAVLENELRGRLGDSGLRNHPSLNVFRSMRSFPLDSLIGLAIRKSRWIGDY
jgi:hypothetical protein